MTKTKRPSIFVHPAPGGLVRLPDTHAEMAAEGQTVADDAYWRRRLRHGDVIEGKPKSKSKAAPSPVKVAPTDKTKK